MDEREYQLTDCQMRLEVIQDRCKRIEAENARLQYELDESFSLVERISALREKIAAENARLREDVQRSNNALRAAADIANEYRAENARLRELLSDVWTDSTIEFDDKRIDYVVVQMTRSVYIDLCNEVRRKSPHGEKQ